MAFSERVWICRKLYHNFLWFLKSDFHNHANKNLYLQFLQSSRSQCRPKVMHLNALSATFSCAPLRFAQHTTKGWKYAVKNRLADESAEISTEDISAACEEGTEAVPHADLMSALQKCTSVEEQINKLCLIMSLTTEDVENRKRFAQSLFELFQPFLPNMQISLFGSSINGFGFKGCDCDVCIDTGYAIEEDEKPKVSHVGTRYEVPTVAEVENGSVSSEYVESLPPRLFLRFVRRVFRQYGKDIQEPILFIKARHPILRFYNKKYNLFCDFSLGNNISLRNTRVMRFIGLLDDRAAALIKILRYWGKHCGFIGDIEQFNSYAFSLMVIYFLQNTSPPVLPSISEILNKSGSYLLKGQVGDDELLHNDLKKMVLSKNTQTVEQLLKEFFFFYLYFDFSQVLCPLSGSTKPKTDFTPDTFQFSTISLQDPFRPPFNVSHAALAKSCSVFLKSVLKACVTYQNNEMWVPNLQTIWGIPLLLNPHDQDQPQCKEMIHAIEIPLLPSMVATDKETLLQKATETVADVLQRGLLFECKTLRASSNIPDVQLKKNIAQINCSAYYNVFSGRSNLRRMNIGGYDVNSVEEEHEISVNLSQKTSGHKQLLFSFRCGCFELEKHDITHLLVTLTFKRNDYQPVVVVFLKEYLPKIVQQSL